MGGEVNWRAWVETYRTNMKKHRAATRLIESDEFKQAWIATPVDERPMEALANCDPVALKQWVVENTHIPLDEMSTSRLRRLAQKANVYNYSRLMRRELIRDLQMVGAKNAEG